MYKSTFMGLNTALRGVLAHQNALDVTGHNIANISTDGYTRQRAEMVTAPAWSSPSAMSQTAPGQMGTGVEVLRIERLRDAFIDANVRQQFGRQANSQAMVEQLAQVEAAFGEPGDTGLNALMTKYFAAMDQVAAAPNDPGARNAFIAAGQALAQGFRQVSTDLQAVATQSDLRLNQTVTEINGISQRIAALNTEIRRSIEHGHQPNDLLDERDRLMDGLSKLINFTSTTSATGEVTITFGTTAPIALVDPLAANGFNSITRAQLNTAFGNGDLTSGRAFADERMWDPANGLIQGGTGFLSQLDTLASEIVVDMNAAHAAGTDLAGNAGGPLFAGGSAAAMQFVLANANLVAASSSPVGTPEPGNGGNFARILDDATAGNPARMAAQALLGGQTWEGFYSSIIGSVGSISESANRDMDNADVLVEMAQGRRDQVSGVSMDEEMSNMLRFQHAYNASARVMTTMDDALDMIINRMGRVGL